MFVSLFSFCRCQRSQARPLRFLNKADVSFRYLWVVTTHLLNQFPNDGAARQASVVCLRPSSFLNRNKRVPGRYASRTRIQRRIFPCIRCRICVVRRRRIRSQDTQYSGFTPFEGSNYCLSVFQYSRTNVRRR